MAKFLSMCAAVGLFVTSAQADLLLSFDGTRVSDGNTIWTYHINLTANELLYPGDYFTIYDFAPALPDVIYRPYPFNIAWSFVGATPPQVNPPDDPSLLNLIFQVQGSAPYSDTQFGPFEITTPGTQPSPATRVSYYAGEATYVVSPGGKIDNMGVVLVPAIVPEPSSALLLAFAIVVGAISSAKRYKERQKESGR